MVRSESGAGVGTGVGVGVAVGTGVGVGVGVGFSVSCMYCEDTYPVFPLYVTLYQLAFEMSSTGTVVPYGIATCTLYQ